ncbi:MAG: helix-turn-helix domain-containing protein [Rhodoblastus sp.]|uniref:helix-turn-helix domain-containing protein n=1 Tax=Rhodoblastus sp. TaxID=1962975 RepID=UPI003F9AAEB0
MTPEQCRAARGWLDWTQADLAAAANVSLSTVRDFEKGRRIPVSNNLIALRSALEAMGLGFVYANVEGQTRPCGITYAAPEKKVAH